VFTQHSPITADSEVKQVEQTINPPTIRNFISTNIQTVSKDTPLQQVVNILIDRESPERAVILVMDSCEEPLGFISERDCLKHLSNQMFHANPNCCAKSLITQPPKHISPETDLFTAASIMFSHHENYLPVTEDEKLIGIISLQGILRGLNDYRNQITQATTKSKFPPDLHKIANHRFIVGPPKKLF
jgi:signal-transduction protein with cAMP-binding, CBS, and nucleotidyltransferase domain